MDNKKFEKLIDLVINENEEQARELFHEIVVEKSREIYESIMDEEMMADSMHGDDMEESDEMIGEVGDLMDEITAEESGMMEEDDMMDGIMEEDDEDMEVDSEEEEVEYDLDDEGEEAGEDEEGLENRVVDLEEKLDELMAEFESLLGDEGGEGDEDEEVDAEEEEEEVVAEAVQLQKVSVTHGDNGVQTKSPVAANAGKSGMASKPVKFSGDTEAVPNAPKAPSNEYAKGHKDVEGAGKFGNTPGQKGRKLENAPKATTSQASGVNTKSPVAK